MIPNGRTAARLDVGRELARHRAGVLLIITLLLWLHQWLPALSVAAFLVWILLHNRLEGDFGAHLLRGGGASGRPPSSSSFHSWSSGPSRPGCQDFRSTERSCRSG